LKNRILFFLTAAFILNAAVCYPQQKKPKNIIFLIGDGMGLNAVTSSVYYLDNSQFRRFPFTGLVVTRSANQLITDSGAGVTSYATGNRTKNQSISVDTAGVSLETVLDYARSKGLATGIVATNSITDATPAGFYAHVVKRTDQNRIAEYLLEGKVDIAIGGGQNYFLPKGMGGERKDNKNIIDSLKARGYKVPFSYDDLKNTPINERIISLLDKGPMPKASERSFSLGDLTDFTLRKLNLSKKGFFVMIEGSQIDSYEHLNDFKSAFNELRDFNTAVKKALDFAENDKNTLVVVIADHETGGLSITGGDFNTPVVKWTTGDHSAAMIGVFAYGPGSNLFSGIIDNFQIGRIIFKLMGKKL
jgi:alkaline phosphatase